MPDSLAKVLDRVSFAHITAAPVVAVVAALPGVTSSQRDWSDCRKDYDPARLLIWSHLKKFHSSNSCPLAHTAAKNKIVKYSNIGFKFRLRDFPWNSGWCGDRQYYTKKKNYNKPKSSESLIHFCDDLL